MLLLSLDAGAQSISPGDNVFVRARVLDCDLGMRYVEFAEVRESGKATFFKKFEVSVSGLDPQRIAELLADQMEQESGYRPTTINVHVVPESDHEANLVAMRETFEDLRDVYECFSRGPSPHRDIDLRGWPLDSRLSFEAPYNNSLNTDARDAGAG